MLRIHALIRKTYPPHTRPENSDPARFDQPLWISDIVEVFLNGEVYCLHSKHDRRCRSLVSGNARQSTIRMWRSGRAGRWGIGRHRHALGLYTVCTAIFVVCAHLSGSKYTSVWNDYRCLSAALPPFSAGRHIIVLGRHRFSFSWGSRLLTAVFSGLYCSS